MIAPQDAGSEPADVAVIGAGVVGSAIARLLSGYQLDVTLLDARDDVGDGTSKANTAILHTGFDAAPGTLESRLVAEGYHLLKDYADRTGIPYEPTGAVLVAWDAEQLAALPGLREKAERNGYRETEIIDADEVYRRIPALGPGALGGLTVPDESIICTWTATLALATDAVNRGARLRRAHRVSSVRRESEYTVLHTNAGEVRARWVVNAAGLGSDTIDALFGFDRFQLHPRRGELLVYDKQARSLVDPIVLPVPSKLGKGVLISPTIYGNVMLGPTAEDREDREDSSTSADGFAFLRDKGERIMPALLDEEVTASYAGLRAASNLGDYLIEVDDRQRYAVAGGIRSTGLTSSMAVAEYLVDQLGKAGLRLTERTALPAPPRMPNIGEAGLRPYADAERIARDPEYGTVTCFCERVTRGEIRDALHSTIPPRDLGGLRRRTRAMNGRCQGFYCGATVTGMLAEAINEEPADAPANEEESR
ncbi:glycerol-3-phosphate dehydrogenase [Tamaricihabitans halophyticus]|uniref:Glycerol-3-phosphate dehydrogenase n=1 Tax=Tamaricihabitans halophyticus TaxID=1262583 RepID=A0A4R2QN27_9PSEU|nr:NAD(P)/FAD-dependent oxidoreductase [Tamaricihabitans halophyticus]TCP48471.1 glycerol-3-phosphate dehydrogenase [Tamaricihabitans halophyticus]